jgi:hypothetical protein
MLWSNSVLTPANQSGTLAHVRYSPAGEAMPVFAGWTGTYGTWNTALTPSNFNFGGRSVTETVWKDGADTCYFSGSAFQPFTKISGGNWPVANDGTNVYGPDTVGQSGNAVWYYRAHGKAPCASTIYQTMVISCDTNPISTCLPGYINNTLKVTIDPATVTSARASASETENWSPTQQQINTAKLLISVHCLLGLLCSL